MKKKTIYLKGEKSSYDRQFVRCGVGKKNIPKVGKPDNTNTITDSHTHKLQTQNEIESPRHIYIETKKNRLSFVCLLFTFHFRCQLSRLKLRYSNYACLPLDRVSHPKQMV